MSQTTKTKKIGVIIAITIVIAASAASAFLIPSQTTLTIIPETEENRKKNDALGAAQRFVVTTPTFAFDGDINTLDTEFIGLVEPDSSNYLVEFSFDSSHIGFGNREGQNLGQNITHHKMEIIVSEGVVTSAITDQEWDELNHQYVLKNPKPKLQSSDEGANPFIGRIIDYHSLIDAIKSRGLLVQEVETLEDSFFSVPTKVISVSGINLQVYEFDTQLELEIAKELVSPDGTEIGLSVIRWIDVPHFYNQGKIIVQYIGNNPEILSLLDSLLGKQFAGM